VVIVGIVVAVILLRNRDETPDPTPTPTADATWSADPSPTSSTPTTDATQSSGNRMRIDAIEFEANVEGKIWEKYSADVWVHCGEGEIVLETGMIMPCDMWDLDEDPDRLGAPSELKITITHVDTDSGAYAYEYQG
jgi:hypothetical protein